MVKNQNVEKWRKNYQNVSRSFFFFFYCLKDNLGYYIRHLYLFFFTLQSIYSIYWLLIQFHSLSSTLLLTSNHSLHQNIFHSYTKEPKSKWNFSIPFCLCFVRIRTAMQVYSFAWFSTNYLLKNCDSLVGCLLL